MASSRHLLKLALFAPLALLSPRGSSEEIAPINVSLAIQQSCIVQSADDLAAAQPSVSCLHGEAFGIARTTADATPTPAALRVADVRSGATIWTVTF